MKFILFDLDGTLIDSTSAILESFKYAFDKFDFSKPKDENIKSLIGYPLELMFKNLSVQDELVPEFVGAYKEIYNKIKKEKTTLLPDAKKAIQKASEFAKLAVVTTKTSKSSAELLSDFMLKEYFEVIIGREDVLNPKPDPEPILKALKFLQADIDKSYMIGDTCLDMNSAKSSKIKGISVLCGYGKKDELEKCSDYTTNNTFEAIKLIYSL